MGASLGERQPPGQRDGLQTVPYCSGVPASHVVLLLLAGLGAGIFNGVAGGGA